MRPRSLASFTLLALVSGGCGLVLGLGDYEDQPGSQATSSAGGSSTSSATGGGGAGGSTGVGGATSCGGDACAAPGAGEQGCCYTDFDGNELCARVVDDYGEACVPLGLAGRADATCPSADVNGESLPGCCLDEGLCGVTDPAHPDLGCVPGAAVNLPDKPCGTGSCGTFCINASKTTCRGAKPPPLGVYTCAARCADGADGCEKEVAAVAECTGAVTECDEAGLPLYSGCLPDQVKLAACRKDEDCVIYCAGQASCANPGDDQYGTTDECLAFCGLMSTSPPGMGNSIACRMQQLVGVIDGSAACSAEGPSGAGTKTVPDQPVCGNACPTYCWLMEEKCPTQFTASYGGSAACNADCVAFPSAPPYFGKASTTPPSDTVQCRLQFAVKAAAAGSPADVTTACNAADKVSTSCHL